jgi:hypothetical protein
MKRLLLKPCVLIPIALALLIPEQLQRKRATKWPCCRTSRVLHSRASRFLRKNVCGRNLITGEYIMYRTAMAAYT